MEPFFNCNLDEREMIKEKFGGKTSSLSVWSTLSSFLFFAAMTVPYAYTSVGRRTYLQLLLYGTLGSYGWLAIRSVC